MKKIKNNLVFILSISLSILYNMQLIKAQSPTNVNNTTYTSGMHIFTDPQTIVSPSDNSSVNFSGTAQVEYQPGALVHLQPGFSVTGLTGSGYFHGVATNTVIGENSCSAFNLGQSDTVVKNIIMVDTVMWFKFIATDKALEISSTLDSGSLGKINKMELFGGNCSGLTKIDSVMIQIANTSKMSMFELTLTIGNTYYLKTWRPKVICTGCTLENVDLDMKIARFSNYQFHTLFVCSDGNVMATGLNDHGALGTGNNVNYASPTPVIGITNVVAVSAGSSYSLALKRDGTVWSWGMAGNELGIGSVTTDQLVPIQINGLTDIIAIAAGTDFAYALKNDGTLWSWGNNWLGTNASSQSTPLQIPTLSGIVAVSVGDKHVMALDNSGNVWMWGMNSNGLYGNSNPSSNIPIQITGLPTIKAIAAGLWHSVLLSCDGRVFCAGLDVAGQIGNGTFVNSVPAFFHVLGLTNIISIGAGTTSSFAITASGSLWEWGEGHNTPFQISGISNVVSVYGTGSPPYTVVTEANGTTWVWGGEVNGDLGVGTYSTASETNYPTPTQVPTGCTSISPISVFNLDGSNTICAGSSVQLSTSIIQGACPYIYSWSPASGLSNTSIANPIASPTSTTTYTVTITDVSNGYSLSGQTTVYVDQGTAFTIPSYTICPGQSALLYPNLTYLLGNFSWSNGGNTGAISVNPTTTTTYTCTWTPVNGCPSTATSTVTISTPPVPTITGDQSACTAGASIPYTITNMQTTGSYTITPTTDGTVTTSLTTNGNFAVTWNSIAISSGGSFIVTYVNPLGCVSSTTFSISPCCINGTDPLLNPVLDNSFASVLPSLNGGSFTTVYGTTINVTGKIFSINGIFTVDQDLTFNDCNILLGENATINVLPHVTLLIEKSHLQGCNMMWDGIYEYNSSSNIQVNSSIIEDAKIAVYANVGGQYQLSNSVFNKNYESLVVNNNSSSSTVTGCLFTCRNLTYYTLNNVNTPQGILPNYNYSLYTTAILKPAFPSYPTNAKSFIGIDALNSSSLTFGDGTANGNIIATLITGNSINVSNVFDYLDNGIYANKSDINIYNNLFENIKANPNPCLFCMPPPPSGNGIITQNASSRFFVPHTLTVGGINTYQLNSFYSNTIGINSTSYNNTLYNNVFYGIFSYGIEIYNGATLTNDIENNTMHNINGGIYCFNIGNTNSTNIIHNNFDLPPVTPSRFINNNAIFINNTSLITTNVIISNNVIDYPLFGIYMYNVQGGQVESNHINFTTVSSNPSNTEAGIKAVNCSSLDISDNTIGYAWAAPAITALRGIYLQATPNSTVFRNTLNKMGTGIYAYSDCHVSKLECNNFNSCTNGFVFNGVNGAIIGDQLTGARSTGNKWNGMAGTAYITGTVNDTHPTTPNWYWDNSGANTDAPLSPMTTLNYRQTSANNCSQRMVLAKTDERELNVGNIVRGATTYDTLSTQYLQNDSTFAFHYLISNDSLLHLTTSDSSVYNSFVNAAAPINLGKFEMVNKFLSDSLMANTLEAAKVNQSIKVQSAIQDNKKTVNNLLLNKVNYEQNTANIYGLKYQFSTEDTATLMNIALQNPFFAGDAVYTARVLLFMDVNDDMDDSDRRVMHINPPKETSTIATSVFKLYPNPNNGNMTLEYNLNGTGLFTIYDVSGRLIKQQLLTSENTTATINAAELDAGVYLYEIKVNDKKVKIDKLIILK